MRSLISTGDLTRGCRMNEEQCALLTLLSPVCSMVMECKILISMHSLRVNSIKKRFIIGKGIGLTWKKLRIRPNASKSNSTVHLMIKNFILYCYAPSSLLFSPNPPEFFTSGSPLIITVLGLSLCFGAVLDRWQHTYIVGQ